ncbi:MAG: hypothetical protein LH473_12220 [Chitinophagales bacterium]|nr:hypothetical protein [Chitinophagales bacterium]
MRNFTLILVILGIFISEFCLGQNLGIGISSPTQRLDIAGNFKFSGAMMPNGIAGTSGQVLISQGAGVAPIWGDGVPGQIWQTNYSTDSSNLTYDGGTIWYSLPGMSNTITVPTTTNGFDALIYTDGSVQWMLNKDTGTTNSIVASIGLFQDGVLIRQEVIPILNRWNLGQGIGNWALTAGVTGLSAGSHTYETKAMVYKIGATPVYTTLTFCDPNITGKIRLSSVAVFLVRK